jgi:hypothetical protein
MVAGVREESMNFAASRIVRDRFLPPREKYIEALLLVPLVHRGRTCCSDARGKKEDEARVCVVPRCGLKRRGGKWRRGSWVGEDHGLTRRACSVSRKMLKERSFPPKGYGPGRSWAGEEVGRGKRKEKGARLEEMGCRLGLGVLGFLGFLPFLFFFDF